MNSPLIAPESPLVVHTADKLPDPWLVDSEFLLKELARIRSLALAVPLTLETFQPTNTVVDALWRLEEQLRFLLRLHRERQYSFGQKVAEHLKRPRAHAKVGREIAASSKTISL